MPPLNGNQLHSEASQCPLSTVTNCERHLYLPFPLKGKLCSLLLASLLENSIIGDLLLLGWAVEEVQCVTWHCTTLRQVFCALLSIQAQYELRLMQHPDLSCLKTTLDSRSTSFSSAAMGGGCSPSVVFTQYSALTAVTV